MFKVKNKQTGKVLTVYTSFVNNNDRLIFLTYHNDSWYPVLAENYAPYESLSDKFKVGEKYSYPCGFNNTDYVQIKSIKGEYACVHSNMLNDEIVIGLNDLVLEDK